jgi:hypothetical protein
MFPISCRDLELMLLDPGLFGQTGEADSAPAWNNGSWLG